MAKPIKTFDQFIRALRRKAKGQQWRLYLDAAIRTSSFCRRCPIEVVADWKSHRVCGAAVKLGMPDRLRNRIVRGADRPRRTPTRVALLRAVGLEK